MANTKEFNITGNSVEVLNANAKAAESAGKSYTSAKQELRALQNQMLEMDQSSEEFKKASKRAAELKDNISDLSAEISANAGNAFEGLSNNVSLFGSRLMDLDLKGAGQALTGMGNAVSRIDFKTLKNEVGGLVTGLGNLAKAVLTNPFFLIGGALAAIVVYWKDISDLVSNKSGMIKSLQQQSELLSRQTKILEKNVTLLKSTKASAGEIYQAELNVLAAKDKQLTAAYKLALLEGEQAAINETRAALDDLRAEKQAKLNQTIAEGHSIAQDIVAEGDKDVALQQAKIKASQQYVDKAQQLQIAISEQKKQQEKLNAELAKAAEYANQFNGDSSEAANYARSELRNTKEKVATQEKLIAQSEKDLKIIKAKGVEVWNNTITAEEQAKKDEEAALLKARRDAEAKKLADEILAIEKEMEQFRRRGMSAQEVEIFLANEKYKIQKETFERAKKSKEELQELESQHNTIISEINLKYTNEKWLKQQEANALFLKQQEELQQKQKELEEKHQEEQKQRAKELNDFIIEGESQLAESKWAIANTSVELLSTLFQKNKKAADVAFALEKALAIGKIVVSTRAANAEVLAKQLAFFASSGPAALPLAAASSAPMLAANNINAAASIASIVASGVSRFMNGGSVGSSGSLPSSPSGTTAPTQTIGGFLPNQPMNQPPIQAYVIGGQVATSIEAQQLIQNQSRLGG